MCFFHCFQPNKPNKILRSDYEAHKWTIFFFSLLWIFVPKLKGFPENSLFNALFTHKLAVKNLSASCTFEKGQERGSNQKRKTLEWTPQSFCQCPLCRHEGAELLNSGSQCTLSLFFLALSRICLRGYILIGNSFNLLPLSSQTPC